MSEVKPIIGFDTETFPICQETQHPRLVCLSLATPTDTDLLGNDNWNVLHETLAGILADRTTTYVGQNLGYDLAVIGTNFPDLLPLIFDALDAGVFSDTMIREKLLVLSSTGDLEYRVMPDGSKTKIHWSLAALVDYYYHIDISGDKTDPCAWRLNYNKLDGIPASEYPPEAREYAISDSTYLVGKNGAPGIWTLQEERRQELIKDRGIDPFKEEAFRVQVDFCLKLMSGLGAKTDPEAVAKVEAMLAEQLKPERLNLLIASGILVPETAARPHANGAQDHLEGCPQIAKRDKKNPCKCPPKMAAGDDEHVDTKKLKEYVLTFANSRNTVVCPTCVGEGNIKKPELGSNTYVACVTCKASGRVEKPAGTEGMVKLRYTEKGNLQVDVEFLEDYGYLDPVLSQYEHRQYLQKLVSTEIPRLKMGPPEARVVAPLVYPQYDVMKETGRTSSFSSKSPDYASFCLNVGKDKETDEGEVLSTRGCFVPHEGFLLFSVDYSVMELGTLAQTCYELFGYSEMRNQINAGVDLHAFTGAQLAYAVDEEFRKLSLSHGADEKKKIFDVFKGLKKSEEGMYADRDMSQAAFFRHWRKFAKPTNLGLPGGLGAPTLVKYAKKNYGVLISLDDAKLFKELWLQTYPEMPEYFNYINTRCLDPYNKGWDEKEKQEYDKYCYDSPFGLHRAGCNYCAAANGLGLQTRSADGALAALTSIIPACFTGRGSSILGPVDGKMTVKPWGFIHDEIVGEIKVDDLIHDRIQEIRRLMVEAMRLVTPDVTPSANACLMRRWDKNAEPVFDAGGRLTVWEPAPAK